MGKKKKERGIPIPPEATARMKALDQVVLQGHKVIAQAQGNQKQFINGYLMAKGIQPKRWRLSDDRTKVIVEESKHG